jgi:hypothetical protein
MMDYAGAYAPEIVSAMANLGAVLNAQAPANTTEAVDGVPAGQAKYLRAALPLNNESIFGQSVREPTNRHNAERAPGGMSMLASGGLLSSDCANTGDTSQIPLPLGNGNVPCRVQPGWTFKGVTAQFQRLTRAPK